MLLDMGSVPLANAFCTDEADRADEFRAPLSLVMCKNCRLIQIRDLVPREQLFRSYLWVTGTSTAAADYATKFAKRLRERHL
ncbi:MAG: class I SAM-dependent methyltransferase, partial [Vicinamibacteria bacterium]